jgi:type IV secretion system protein VirD4
MKSSVWLKVIAGLVFVGVALTAAAYIAGFMFLVANKTNPLNTTLTTYYEYWYWYYDDPAQKGRLQFAAAASLVLSFGVPLFLMGIVNQKVRSLHGDARFANASEVRASGLMGNTGIIVGQFMGRYLMLAGQLFVLLAAPTRSGKGVGIVIPNLLNFSDSLVVLDVKQENYDITSGYRARYGQEVYMVNFFAEDCRTHRWNPLSYISENPHFRVGDILAIGFILYPAGDSKDAFFNDQARNLFLGLVLYLVETPELPRTIGEALRQSSGKGKGLKKHLADLIEERETSERPLSESCTDAIYRFIANSENTLASILASFNAPLTIFANPIVDAATSADDFLLTEVRKKRMSIYVGITPDKLPQAGLILNLFFSQLINLNTKELPQKNPDLKYQCLLLMDEFTALGKVEIIKQAVSYMAGYNLRLLPIIQSMSQLVSVYGEHDARTLATNHALNIMYPPKENKDAQEYSETLGYFTEKSTSSSKNFKGGFSLNGGGASRGESVSDQKRALMMPQELREMGQDKEIVILENTKPIMAEKVMYYKDHAFIDRLKEVSPTLASLDKQFGPLFFPKLPTKKQLEDVISSGELGLPMPTLDLDLHLARVESRTRYITEEDLAADGSEEGGLNLAALAHDFDDLPALDDPENPSAESVAALVGDFFSRLEQSEGPFEEEGGDLVEESVNGAGGMGREVIDSDGVISFVHDDQPDSSGGVDLSLLDSGGGSDLVDSHGGLDLSALDNGLELVALDKGGSPGVDLSLLDDSLLDK